MSRTFGVDLLGLSEVKAALDARTEDDGINLHDICSAL
jgi:hypothetical protein